MVGNGAHAGGRTEAGTGRKIEAEVEESPAPSMASKLKPDMLYTHREDGATNGMCSRAIVAVLLGSGLRRHEGEALTGSTYCRPSFQRGWSGLMGAFRNADLARRPR